MVNLVFSTSRRFRLFKDTVESLVHYNPELVDLIENVYILDDRSSFGDRNKMEKLINNHFPHKGRLITFNDSSHQFAYVNKLNFIRNLSLDTKYTLFIEDDRKNIAPLNLSTHIQYLENNPDIDQISLIENYWIQDEETKKLTISKGEYWDPSLSEFFRYSYGYSYNSNNEMVTHWAVSRPILSLGAVLNRNSIYFKAKFKPQRHYESDFHHQLNSKFLYTQSTLFLHTGWTSSLEQ